MRCPRIRRSHGPYAKTLGEGHEIEMTLSRRTKMNAYMRRQEIGIKNEKRQQQLSNNSILVVENNMLTANLSKSPEPHTHTKDEKDERPTATSEKPQPPIRSE